MQSHISNNSGAFSIKHSGLQLLNNPKPPMPINLYATSTKSVNSINLSIHSGTSFPFQFANNKPESRGGMYQIKNSIVIDASQNDMSRNKSPKSDLEFMH